MRSEELNRPILELDDSHPAKKFLEAFIGCLTDCVGQELGLDGETPVDQAWTSSSDGRVWRFSGFAYEFLSFDILLDGFLDNAPSLTPSETWATGQLPLLRSMMDECAQAARQDGNNEILELTKKVQEMLNLWEQYLGFRKEMVARSQNKS